MSDYTEPFQNSSSIEGWTKEEKFNLLQALKVFRSHDVDSIQEYIPTKNSEEIASAIKHYKNIASKHPVFEKKINKPTKQCNASRVPLTGWAKLLTDNLNLDELKTETSTAVRMIAELEKLPDPVTTENIDFRKIYHAIANAMEGKTIVPDKINTAVFNMCIIETALASKSFIKTSTFKYFIQNLDLSEKDGQQQQFLKPTENQELTILRHLASQKRYNPLKISENNMKPSCESQLDANV